MLIANDGQIEVSIPILATSKSHASQCPCFAGMRKCPLNQFAAFSLGSRRQDGARRRIGGSIVA